VTSVPNDDKLHHVDDDRDAGATGGQDDHDDGPGVDHDHGSSLGSSPPLIDHDSDFGAGAGPPASRGAGVLAGTNADPAAAHIDGADTKHADDFGAGDVKQPPLLGHGSLGEGDIHEATLPHDATLHHEGALSHDLDHVDHVDHAAHLPAAHESVHGASLLGPQLFAPDADGHALDAVHHDHGDIDDHDADVGGHHHHVDPGG
jgi:hypothetical protein